MIFLFLKFHNEDTAKRTKVINYTNTTNETAASITNKLFTSCKSETTSYTYITLRIIHVICIGAFDFRAHSYISPSNLSTSTLKGYSVFSPSDGSSITLIVLTYEYPTQTTQIYRSIIRGTQYASFGDLTNTQDPTRETNRLAYEIIRY